MTKSTHAEIIQLDGGIYFPTWEELTAALRAFAEGRTASSGEAAEVLEKDLAASNAQAKQLVSSAFRSSFPTLATEEHLKFISDNAQEHLLKKDEWSFSFSSSAIGTRFVDIRVKIRKLADGFILELFNKNAKLLETELAQVVNAPRLLAGEEVRVRLAEGEAAQRFVLAEILEQLQTALPQMDTISALQYIHALREKGWTYAKPIRIMASTQPPLMIDMQLVTISEWNGTEYWVPLEPKQVTFSDEEGKTPPCIVTVNLATPLGLKLEVREYTPGTLNEKYPVKVLLRTDVQKAQAAQVSAQLVKAFSL